MRELDTESPVVWPAWCYTGEPSGESTSVHAGGRHCERGETADLGTRIISKGNDLSKGNLAANTATALDARGASPQGAAQLSAAATPKPPRGRRRQQTQNGLDAPQVKAERLTPDNNSTSSRSITPSSLGHPSTSPNASSLPGGPEGLAAPPPPHVKHMEQMMGRNYSDFMRSLAAKYNSTNPNEYLSAGRNGYPTGLDARFPALKGASSPFLGLMHSPASPTLTGVASLTAKDSKDPQSSKQLHPQPETAGLFASPANLFPPMLDMSSTQALLQMVRTANAAQSAAELESYLKGASKREVGLSSPLDLSSPGAFVPRKRARGALDTSIGVARRPDSLSPKPSPKSATTSSTPSHSPSSSAGNLLQQAPMAMVQASTGSSSASSNNVSPNTAHSPPPGMTCPSLCGHMPCGEGQMVNRWSVEDVVNYVASIDICAEYAQNFREHRIDGASLPLLSEEHLTGPIGMKLGPALKLRVLLARKLGACTVCLHCAHCHRNPTTTLTRRQSQSAN